MTTRRGFLATLLAASAAPALSWADVGWPAFLAAARDADGSDALYGVSDDGADLFRVPLPARAHCGTAHPERPEAVVFARRPGTFALVLNCATGHVIARLESPAGRHFMGHGVFSADGETLYTAENAYDIGTGRIGLWRPSEGWRRIGEIESHGKGPHDLRLMPDGTTLVVANGGIDTHPDTGRDKLNIPTMQPNLAYLAENGTLLEKIELPHELHFNSIRHLALGRDGLVAFAMQWQGEVETAGPLLGLHRRGAAPILAAAPLADERAMRGYAGSVAFDASGATVAITSPVGGRAHAFTADGAFVSAVSRADICGLGTGGGRTFATDGLGGVFDFAAGGLTPLAVRSRAWDNHIVPLRAL